MRKISAVLLAAALLAWGCGDDDGPGDSGAVDSGSSDSGSSDSGASDSGASDSGASDSGLDAAPVSCGGLGGGTCAPTEFCDYPDNICGADDGTGICRPRPTDCPDAVMPVCACDGTTYGNECEANAAGVDVNDFGGCAPPERTFACGYRFCDVSMYCRVSIDDTGLPPSYECLDLPTTCSPSGPDCACVAGEACGAFCEQDSAGHLTLTCPGG